MKHLVIVGGSKGIGKAIALQFLETHKVTNISRNEPDFTHQYLTHHSCDVLAEDLPDLEQPIDYLIYCPGSINLKPVGRLKLDDFRADFEINVIGAVKTIQKYLDNIKEGTNPSIVLFSTVATDLGMPFHASVAASKSAVEGLVKSIGAELAPTVRVNAVAPTVTNTDLASKLLRNEKQEENMRDRHPLKKYLQPEEVANMASFLCSDKSLSVSGQVFKLDCGIVSFKL